MTGICQKSQRTRNHATDHFDQHEPAGQECGDSNSALVAGSMDVSVSAMSMPFHENHRSDDGVRSIAIERLGLARIMVAAATPDDRTLAIAASQLLCCADAYER